MKIIQTQQDIITLRSTDSFTLLLSYIQKHFDHFHFTYRFESDTNFTLNHLDPIILLEPGDNLHDLFFVNLNREDGGPLGCMPVYAQAIELPHETGTAYMIGVAYNYSL